MDQLVKEDNSLTETKIEESNALFAKHRALVLEKLIQAIVDVQPVLHVNAKPSKKI